MRNEPAVAPPSSRTSPTLTQLAWLVLAAIVAAVALERLAGARWHGFYGAAAVALAAAPMLWSVLARGLVSRGRARWPALLVVVPLVVAALIQIAFWQQFFSSPENGIRLGMGRLMLLVHAGGALTAACAAWGVVVAIVVWRAALAPPRS